LCHIKTLKDPRVIVGSNAFDDAAVYDICDGQALIQSVDFFTPVVDDPYQFGSIAAANSLSDIYAMGAKPIFTLSIIGFPSKTLPLTVMQEILRGGSDKAEEAGIPILGGHSIDDPEPKYGLIVNGLVDKNKVITNAGAKPGDVLILTKPLGIGIITTGIKGACVSEETIQEAVRVMSTLNRAACEVMTEVGASACTDITGYGLLGHLLEMVSASNVTATISFEKTPFLEEAKELVEQGIVPGGTRRNLDYAKDRVSFEDGFTEEEKLLLADAQTSGGLLISTPKDKAGEMLEKLSAKEGVLAASPIGEITDEKKEQIRVLR
jgi:selenide,water dikinase